MVANELQAFAAYEGGAIKVIDSFFNGNSADVRGGVAISTSVLAMEYQNCTFTGE